MALPWGKLQRLGAVALVVLSTGFFGLRCAISQDVAFVTQSDRAPWIMPPAPVSAELRQWGGESVPLVSFLHELEVGPSGSPVTLTLRALGSYEVRVNGDPLAGGRDDGSDWRRERPLDLGAALRPGRNQLRIDIANAHGPALLSLRVDGLAEPVRSDGSWLVFQDGRLLGSAISADDTRRNPGSLAVETPARALRDQADGLLACFMLGLLGFLAARRFASPRLVAALPALVLAASGVAWLLWFARKLVQIPIAVGFDARHHKLYVDWLQQNLSVPVATDGWSVYHPPLFYAAAAVLEWLGEVVAGSSGGIIGLKLLPFLAGLANVWVAAALCRRLFPGDFRRRVYAAAFAAVLPVNLYSAAYFSNETFHTLIAGLALLVTVDLLLAPASLPRRTLGLGLLLGLALLTKYTAVLVAAVALFFLAVKLVAVERAGPARVARCIGAVTVPPLLLAGWFYARNLWLFGDPLIANWGDMPGATLKWWQQPGFHTPAYYLQFGESLLHPYLSAFRSFWDSLYSTLWGDGGIAGRAIPSQRHPFWNYDWMSAVYLIAIPASLLIGVGAVRSTATALSDADPHRRAALSFLLTLGYAVLFGLLYLSLRLPFFAQAKASYGLVVMPLLALFFADAVAWLDQALRQRGWLPARAVLHGWLGLFLASCFLAFAA
jgi:hypothetical protein